MPSEHRDSVQRMLADWERERPDLNSSPFAIQGRIMRLSAHLLRQTESWLAPMGLSWEAFSVIVTLRRSGKPYELRPTDLLRESLLTSGAITNRIDRVEKLGLVERRADADDRRSFIIRLTPAGKRLADRSIARHFAAVDDLLDALDSRERDDLARLLSKLLASLEDKTSSQPRVTSRARLGENANAVRASAK
jgi:DNA-binding MarR family transcriptional regulator